MKSLQFKEAASNEKKSAKKTKTNKTFLHSFMSVLGKQAGENTPKSNCLKCQVKVIEYVADPCGHPCFCTECAMKLCTGGRCKICKQFYGGLKRVKY